jgi:nicotinamide mononucleotide transporter
MDSELWTQALRLLDVKNIAVTVLGYPMSYVELFGTIFNLWAVWLAARNRIATWPIGLVGVVLFLALFYQIRLYSDAVEQVYYFITGIYGWWLWSHVRKGGNAAAVGIHVSSPLALGIIAAVTLVLSGFAGYATSRLHIWSPALFPDPASYPYLDALTTVMSFTANLLMAQRRIESWIYWIVVDVIGIGLYYAKDVRLVSLLYAVFLVLAVNGFLSWRRKMNEGAVNVQTETGGPAESARRT